MTWCRIELCRKVVTNISTDAPLYSQSEEDAVHRRTREVAGHINVKDHVEHGPPFAVKVPRVAVDSLYLGKLQKCIKNLYIYKIAVVKIKIVNKTIEVILAIKIYKHLVCVEYILKIYITSIKKVEIKVE